ncbi:MAG: hybrid sensor histidine kinase/response regulator [Anaerolinea sp.]|nr:hybrid sensor histidine kinase/response regulator [Anaerolinea sp.]
MPKILLIDDESLLRDEVADWLEFEGYEVLTAENGLTGLEKAACEVPDLIVCDIAMPALDGHGVLLEVRSNPQLNHIPFIFLTASANYEAMRRGMNLGADDYLTKPFKRIDLLEAIRSRLRKYEEQQEAAHMQLEAVSRAFAEQEERRLLKSRLVAMFSHDFRNPLASILSSSELLKNYEARMSADHKRQHLDRIGGSVRLLLQMLDDMLAVAEMEHGHLKYRPQPVDIGAFMRDVIDEFRLIYSDQYTFVFEEAHSGLIESDPRLLRQILNNLISNAVKYSPSGSTVTARLQGSDSGLQVHIVDQGIGIPEEDQAHLFDAFYRAENVRDAKGSGLGLTIVREAVTLCGGEIHVLSEVGRGSIFTVELPIALR